jgi:DeoR/GlpR family transcriptional regulator of sugar metabolism
MTTDARERQRSIRRRLLLDGEVAFAPLSTEFGVSEMTIRRDIEALESEGAVRRVIGGAIAVGRAAEPPFRSRASHEAREKQHIAEVVVSQLSAGETVIVDSGSTALAVARAIRGRGLDLTVVTPSVLVACELHDEPGSTVILAGGLVRPGELSLVGAEAVEGISRYTCDTYIAGVAGVDARHGLTDYHREDGAVKRAAVAAAGRVLVAADQTKLGRAHLVKVAPLAAIDLLITDAADAHPAVRALRQAGATVLTVPSDPDPRGSE